MEMKLFIKADEIKEMIQKHVHRTFRKAVVENYCISMEEGTDGDIIEVTVSFEDKKGTRTTRKPRNNKKKPKEEVGAVVAEAADPTTEENAKVYLKAAEGVE